jgi:hypothetical protein
MMFGLIFFWFNRKRIDSGDMGYLLVYYYISFMPTWLLSGMRYMSACYVLYLMLARFLNKRWKIWIFCFLNMVAWVLFGYVGFWKTKVY